MKGILVLLTIFLFAKTKAATVDTVTIYRNAMHKNKKCVVIKPDSYTKNIKQFPVVYLLYGYAGDFRNWIIKVPQLKSYADNFQLLIVCPDGDYSSWYFDSPVDTSMKYETHIAKEIPQYIDAHYRTIKERTARAITGLSMGGHGAFFISFRHTDFFGVCGSMSGVMDLNSLNKYDIAKRIGDTISYADNWKKYSIFYVVENKVKDPLAIIFDCGLYDELYQGNKDLHEKMLRLKIAHDYIERPGDHNWNYWANAVQYQLIFFKNYFDKNKTGLH